MCKWSIEQIVNIYIESEATDKALSYDRAADMLADQHHLDEESIAILLSR